jgi:hypothetical protein
MEMPVKTKIYRKNGEVAEMDAVDARRAVQSHPDDWANSPWPKAEKAKPAEPQSPPKAFEAKHKGGGSYAVFDAAGTEVLDKLTKEDAELFNSSAEDAQEAYIAAEKAKRASS